MADFEAPSFSLGLDLDSQSDPRLPTNAAAAAPNPSPQILQDSPVNDPLRTGEEDLDSLHELERAEVEDSDVEPEPESTRVLKRLRRGPGPRPTTQSLSSSLLAKKKKQQLERTCSGNGDDDIEEFSSPEDLIFRDVHPSTQYHSVCSSSKVPLQGQAFFTTQSSSQLKARKREQASDVPSASLSTSHNEFMFPKLTISPLRRFQLLDSDSDSDSDHPSVNEDVSKGAHRIDPSSKESESVASGEKRKVSSITPQKDDLWKDFCPIMGSHIPTPALDEVCEEYFQSAKDKNAGQKFQTDARIDNNNKRCHPNMNNCENFEQCWDSADPLPPAHRYFFHSDPRIQKLVRSRLPNFSPIGVVPDTGNQQPSASDIDYMSQFSNGGASNQKGTQKVNNNRSTRRGRNSHASGGWVDPKSSATIPKDAGKRRVHASGGQSAGQSAGHWYTSPEGRKVS
ncbi:hypothetical protein LWI28_008421 [Acer negundo]|uniref:Uncharacterized protein n=1 Tax=Acer negundo TaxID=4023 RepID=A0AAD5NW68_ACENE|nr:hypothetical protein LWI28_008421 [Acer negundo]